LFNKINKKLNKKISLNINYVYLCQHEQ